MSAVAIPTTVGRPLATPAGGWAARAPLPLDPGLARKLRAHFAPHDAALTRWLGTEPTWVAEGW